MQTLWLPEKINYDGSQLRSLFNYEIGGLVGDSLVAFVGPCKVSPQNMKDGEDLFAGAVIAGDEMLHFLMEIFDRPLITGVLLQRLFAEMIKDFVFQKKGIRLFREGDDLFDSEQKKKKLSISIAAPSTRSTLIHFALNCRNEGTPVDTLSLKDLRINSHELALHVMKQVSLEWQDSLRASWKVFSA